MPRLISIQVGQPETYGDPAAVDPQEQQWRTGIFKAPVAVCRLTFAGLEGDGQADLINHGGPDKAVLLYSLDHYPHWESRLPFPELTAGSFGENLSVSGQSEADVCVGDQWAIGPVVLEVSQPRQPCWKLARRWHLPELPRLVVQTGWSGWYCRVISEGRLIPGTECELRKRPWPQWSITRASRALYSREFPVSEGNELARLPELSNAWREDLIGRLQVRGL